ncbi:MAG: inositol monophosphatase, partial [Deltaproteobacteria bacterium]|nr:inositol monophosphatase [Deltaproteobacteria bacterium]
MIDLRALLAEVISISREAGAIIAEHAQKPRDVHHKGRIDLVTATDVAVENFLRDKLQRLLPGSHFLAEESSPDAPLLENTWIIDPLDGTTNFAHGLPFVATSIALWREGDIQLGVVNAPLLPACFSALRGRGAYRDGTPLRVSATSDLLESLIATGFPYVMDEELPGLLRRMGRVLSQTQGVRRYGAASLDLAFTAAGQYDGYYERRLSPWDVAAGWLLVREAGGIVTRTDGSPFH